MSNEVTAYDYDEIRDQIKDASKNATSSLPNPGGGPVEFKRIRQIELLDGTILFGCTECMNEDGSFEFIRNRVGAVRSHLGWFHNPDRKARIVRAKESVNTLSNALLRVRDAVDEAITLAADESQGTWRTRADAAERNLAKIQKGLKKLGLSIDQTPVSKGDDVEAAQ